MLITGFEPRLGWPESDVELMATDADDGVIPLKR
jgi:hypothetical protein